MNHVEKIKQYSEYYNLCTQGKAALLDYARQISADDAMLADALEIKNKIASGNIKALRGKSAQFAAFVYTLAIEDMEALYKAKNIPQDVFIATVSALGLGLIEHHAKHNEWGLSVDNVEFVRCLRGEVFRLGRLQFLPITISDYWLPPKLFNHPLALGDLSLEVYIPRDGKLCESACLASFALAKTFFPKLGYAFKAFHCCSWLFDPALAQLLPMDSNIVKFQKMFTIFKYEVNNIGLYSVWGNADESKIRNDPTEFPTDTLLRRKLIEYNVSGGIMQDGVGYRLVDAG
jgi:hypothetical protein